MKSAMKPAKHSPEAIKVHPAPIKKKDGKYDKSCLEVHKARIKFDQVELIADLLTQGITLKAICRMPDMPAWRTVYDWIDADANIAATIAQARARGHDAIAEQIIDIIDETTNDTINSDEGYDRANTEWISRSKLRAEMRLKLLSKWSPKKYGDKLDLNHGGQPDNPFEMVETVIVQHEVKK